MVLPLRQVNSVLNRVLQRIRLLTTQTTQTTQTQTCQAIIIQFTQVEKAVNWVS